MRWAELERGAIYRDRSCYAAKLTEAEYGAFLTISRNGVIVSEIAVGVLSGGPDRASWWRSKRSTSLQRINQMIAAIYARKSTEQAGVAEWTAAHVRLSAGAGHLR